MEKTKNKRSWTKTLLSFAKPCRWKMIFSVIFSIISVLCGFVPFYGVYRILAIFIEDTATASEIWLWVGISLAGFAGKLLFFGISTVFSHISAYTILEKIRHKIADKLMHAPLGTVQTKTIGELKNVLVDRVEDSGDRKDEVLHGIDLKLPEGRFTALVGPSGGGKSTVAKLIARFWDVNEGEIKIGGHNVKELSLKQLADTVSFVTQDNFLFNCSLKENIRLGNPNASDAEVYAAAKAACCEEFILRLENGYDTSAGDAGKKLSGGEKQRIAIARAILKNAPIVILDEATAFTDPENEDKIQQSIMALTKGKTLLVIAHRLSTIQNAHQIVVLKEGNVEATGTQAELLEHCALYRDMWSAHIGAKNWAVSQ